MFYVKGNPIVEDELSVLQRLKEDCSLAGMNLFHRFRPTNKNIMTTCPFHKEGQERKPSFGISTEDGTCHCFACGWVGSLSEMISEVFGYQDGGEYGERWLSRNFLTVSVEVRKPLELRLSRGISRDEKVSAPFTEEELDSYRYVHPYMYQRGLTDELIEEFDVGYDQKTECLTFPCYYETGVPAFIARRSVKTKFFNYPRDVRKPVYASDRFFKKHYSFCVVCESIFNCLTCWKYGLPAVALLGTGAYEQYKVLESLPVRKLILGLDPDDAGRKGADRIRKNVRGKIITEYAIPEGYDINDLDDKVLELQEFF